ncbi:hypothetical protein D3C73_747390 [compost metagenome]
MQGALHAAAAHVVFFAIGVRHAGIHRQHHFGRGAPGDLRLDVARVHFHHRVELGAVIGVQGAPVLDGLVPHHARGRERTATEVVHGLVIHRDHARPGAGFDGHVAHRHAPFHGQRADRAAGKFDGVAGAARRTDDADDVQDHVLGGTAERQVAIDLDQHALGFLHQQRLGRQHVLDLGRADAEGQGAQRAVRAGMRIATDDRHARQRCALLGSDHVHDALTQVIHAEFGDAVFFAVRVQRIHLQARDGVVDALGAIQRRHVVVRHRQIGARAPRLAPGDGQAFERLGAGDFMHQVAIDIEQTGAV